MPIGKWGAIGPGGDAERVAGGEAPLLARRGGEARVADHVAGGEDVRHRGAELRVHREPAALVGREPGRREVERLGARRSRPAENSTRSETIRLPDSRLQHRPPRRALGDLDRVHRLAEPEA